MSAIGPYRDAAGAVVVASLAILGAWLPWVRKRPVGTRDGVSQYTSEHVPAAEVGFQFVDAVVVVPALVAVVIVVAGIVTTGDGRRSRLAASSLADAALAVAGGVIVWIAGDAWRHYRDVDRYAAEPGVYLVLAAGLLLVLVGVRRTLAALADR